MGSFSTLIICFTGDIAYSGDETEYIIARKFLNDLRYEILKTRPFLGYIPIYSVPGNHDMLYGNKADRTINDIISDIETRRIDYIQKAQEDIFLLDNYYSFSQKDLCFCYDPFVNVRSIWLSDSRYSSQKKIQINLINSSVLSTIKDNNKGYHYLPEYYFKELSETTADFTITMSHHSPEWFCDESKNYIEECLNSSTNLYLYGHDHTGKGHNIGLADNSGYVVSSGGMFTNKSEYMQSSYTLIKVDFINSLLSSFRFEWKNDAQFYAEVANFSCNFRKKTTNIHHIDMDRDHYAYLISDPRNQAYNSILNYFTFPILSQKNQDPELVSKSIVNIDELLNEIKNNKFIKIKGKENCGKSSLARYLQYYIFETGIATPILLDREFMSGSNYRNFIKRAFHSQYTTDSLLYSKYEQLPVDRRIVIIDEPECIKRQESRKHLIDILGQTFGHIIIISNNQKETNIRQQVNDYIKDEDVQIELYIEPFYSRKRCELIRKLLEFYPHNQKITVAEIENQINTINTLFSSQMKLMELTPDFIVQFVLYWQSLEKQDSGAAILTEVFETNIRNSLLQVFDKVELAPVQVLLENIAYHIHFNKIYPLPYNAYENLVSDYNKRSGNNYCPIELLTSFKKSKILINGNTNGQAMLRFLNRNYLAYFTARSIKRKAGRVSVEDDIKYLLRYIAFGINGDILLFLSYIDMNVRFINAVCQELSELIEGWEEYSIEKANIKYLSNHYDFKNIAPPTSKDRVEIEEHKENAERYIAENEEIELIEQYGYDENSINNDDYKLNKSMVLCKLVSQVLPQFEHMLDIEEKRSIVDLLFSVPNKIAYFALHQIDEDFLEIVEDIRIQNSDNPKVDDSFIGRVIQDISFALILSLYDYFMSTSTKVNTRQFLLDETKNSTLCNRIQKLIGYEVGGYIPEFVENAFMLSKEFDNPTVFNMTIRCIRACLIRHQNIDRVNQERLLSKFYPKNRESILYEKMIRQLPSKEKAIS